MNPTARAKPSYTGVSTRRFGARRARQRGVATLMIVLILLFAMTLIVLAMGRVGLVEQTISGNEQRALKAINAAEAGLEYGMTWLAEKFVGPGSEYLYYTTENPTIPDDCACWPKILTVPNNVTPGSGEIYNVSVTITPKGTGSFMPYSTCSCTNTTVASPYLQVTSTATDTNDASVTATVQQYAVKTSTGTAESRGAPPLVMNGCFDSTPDGTPNVYPCTAADTAFPYESIRTAPSAMTLEECVLDESLHESLRGTEADPQGLCGTAPDDCPPLGSNPPDDAPLDVHGGDVDATLSGTDAAWNAVFPNLTKKEFKNLADYEKGLMAGNAMTVSERNFIYFDSVDPRSDDPADWGFNNDDWTKDLGTGNTDDIGTIDESDSPCGTIEPRLAKHPVVLYFGNGGSTSSACPTLNGTVIIWGVVYYENCDDDGPGWGAGTVFGTVAVEGNLDMLTADGTLCCIENSTGGVASEDKLYSTLVRVPGTWSDL